MKGIMFNSNKIDLEYQVIQGKKTRTWRPDKNPRFELGEMVAIKMPYKYCRDVAPKYIGTPGYTNKMFVKNILMPYRIYITAIKRCNLSDITEEEARKEVGDICLSDSKINFDRLTYKAKFLYIVEKLYGKEFVKSNPFGYAYEFKLIK